jgi:hypothetical protein
MKDRPAPDRSRRMSLMSDYGCEFPVWTKYGRDNEANLALSVSLAQDLRVWQDVFEHGFDSERGWTTADGEERYARAAPGLRDRLISEVGSNYDVVLDAWPVKDLRLREWLATQGQWIG